jgi:hypothetical protein
MVSERAFRLSGAAEAMADRFKKFVHSGVVTFAFQNVVLICCSWL